jgi:hypothetical protein
MTDKLSKALQQVDLTYGDIIGIANEMLADVISPLDTLINAIGADINALSTDELKLKMWEIQYTTYRLVDIKEKALFKAQISEALTKEAYATQLIGTDGTVALKQNVALINTAEETVVEVLYTYISSLLKTKTDQAHRLVDIIKSILMARMQEAKLAMN